MSVAADPAEFALGYKGKPVFLTLPQDFAVQLNAPNAIGCGVVAQLRERDAKLRRPAERVDPGGTLPDWVPRVVFVASLRRRAQDAVENGASWGYPKPDPAQVVVEGVEIHIELIRLDIVVPAGQDGLDPPRPLIVEPSSDIERISADQYSYIGVLGSGRVRGRHHRAGVLSGHSGP